MRRESRQDKEGICSGSDDSPARDVRSRGEEGACLYLGGGGLQLGIGT